MVATRSSPARDSPHRVHFAALDGYRAVAALAVVVVHVALFSGYAHRTQDGVGAFLARADVGVSIFFVLSGFLLYRPFVAARFAGRPTGDLASYARRRILRIFPAYWAALLIVGYVLKAPGFEGPHQLVPHFFLLHVYDIDQLVGGPVQQSWSLAAELGFYAFLPAYAWAVGRTVREPARQLRTEITGVAAIWIGSTLLKVLALAAGVSHARFGQLQTWTPFRLDEFALGMGLAVASSWFAHRPAGQPAWLAAKSTLWGCWAASGALFVVLCTIATTRYDIPILPLFTSRLNFGVRFVYSFCALLFIAPAIFGPQGRGTIHRLLANKVMVWLGLVSYGIYIWHEAVQELYLRWTDQQAFTTSVIEMGLVTVALTLPLAAVSYYVVERPAMRFGRSKPPTPETAPAPTEHTPVP